MESRVSLTEIAALLAVAQDYAFGQPPGSQLRATVLGQRLAAATGADAAEQAATWWTAALRFLGCTGHAFDTARVFGDEIAFRADTMRMNLADHEEVGRFTVAHAGGGLTGAARKRAVAAVLAGGPKAAEENFRGACEVADALAARLGLEQVVRGALAANFERWNGHGLPARLRGAEIPRPMRIAQVAHELEVLARDRGLGPALETIRERSSSAYDPDLVDVFAEHASEWWQEVEPADSWAAALALAPRSPVLSETAARDALIVVADFADLKSPWMSGHSREVAGLAGRACDARAEAAGFVHDLGRVAVPNTIWDKAGPLTRDERDQAERHPLVTDQLLRRVPYTAALSGAASAAHERLDGSGYHRRVTGSQLDEAARTVAAADCYQAMVSDRPHRAALTGPQATTELRAMSAAGKLDGEAVERVLAAGGVRRAARAQLPAGLSGREVEVLRLLSLGLTTRQIADRLVISAKTADHHVQHIYGKIGVSTRGAATLFAIEHGVFAPPAQT